MLHRFPAAHAAHADWRVVTQQVARRLLARGLAQPAPAHAERLGILYIGSPLAAQSDVILAALCQQTGVAQWVGTTGSTVLGGTTEYTRAPALSAMVMELPRGSFRTFHGSRRPPALGSRTPSGAMAAWTALVHADPHLPQLGGLIRDMAGKTETGAMFGGLVSGSASPGPQWAGDLVFGGLSGVMFASDVELRSRVTQGCTPLSPPHLITACEGNLVLELDGRPALDTLLADLGVDAQLRSSRDGEALLGAMPAERLRLGLFAGVASGAQLPPPAPGCGLGEYRVRNVAGIDPHNRLIAIGEHPCPGERLVFCTRDAQTAERDLVRTATELRDELESAGHTLRGGIFVSCIARGEALFREPGHELRIIRAQLGDFPLVGFHANGEIGHSTLFGYTGVLTLFT